MDCVGMWRSETTYRDVGEKITNPLHIATVLKSESKIAIKENNKLTSP